jgi:hypothetical protein
MGPPWLDTLWVRLLAGSRSSKDPLRLQATNSFTEACDLLDRGAHRLHIGGKGSLGCNAVSWRFHFVLNQSGSRTRRLFVHQRR